MRRAVISLCLAAVAVFTSAAGYVPTPAEPRVVGEQAVGPRLVDLTISSPALGRTAKARLLLPARWSAEPHRRWPVLYLLHPALERCCGAGGEYKSWSTQTDLAKLTAGSDVLTVMPEGGAVGWYSNWWNHGKDGSPRWETLHLTELRQLLEQRYRASTKRAIAGPSMGGFGALSYAARHPGMFQAAASYSGAIHTRKVPVIVQGSLLQALQDPLAVFGDVHLQAAIWKEHNPYDLAGKLTKVRLFVSSGDGRPGPLDPPLTLPDPLEPSMLIQAEPVVQRVRQLGGQVATDFYGPGTHTWPYWQRELHRSYQLLLSALDLKSQ